MKFNDVREVLEKQVREDIHQLANGSNVDFGGWFNHRPDYPVPMTINDLLHVLPQELEDAKGKSSLTMRHFTNFGSWGVGYYYQTIQYGGQPKMWRIYIQEKELVDALGELLVQVLLEGLLNNEK